MNRALLYVTECYDVDGEEAYCFDPYALARPVAVEQAPSPYTVRQRVAGEQGTYVSYRLEWKDAA